MLLELVCLRNMEDFRARETPEFYKQRLMVHPSGSLEDKYANRNVNSRALTHEISEVNKMAEKTSVIVKRLVLVKRSLLCAYCCADNRRGALEVNFLQSKALSYKSSS